VRSFIIFLVVMLAVVGVLTVLPESASDWRLWIAIFFIYLGVHWFFARFWDRLHLELWSKLGNSLRGRKGPSTSDEVKQ
jgi:hypothetical protein